MIEPTELHVDPNGATQPRGSLGLTVIRGGRAIPVDPSRGLAANDTGIPSDTGSLRAIAQHGLPRPGLSESVNAWRESNFRNLIRGVPKIAIARRLRIAHMHGALFLKVIRGDGQVEDLGLASLRLMTDNGMGFVVDAFQNLVEMENMKFHGFGTGTTAEAATDTALVTELTTQYNPDSTRPTGTTAEASQKVYQTVATLTPDAGGTIAVTEHCVFSQAATGGGVAFDRSVFSAVNVVAGSDSLQATYQATFNSGG